MRPMRGGGGNMFGRGGPMSPQTTAAKLAIGIVVGSVIAALTNQSLFALLPEAVLGKFFLWQIFSYTFVALDPFGVIIGAFITWSIGGSLEMSWGSRRLLVFALGTVVASAVLTVLLSLVWTTVLGGRFAGAMVMVSVLWVAYGWSMGRTQINLFGIPLTGNTFALIGIGFVLLNAIFAQSLAPFAPQLFGIALTALYVKVGSPRVLVLKLRHWKLQRELKNRSRRLNVIDGDRDERRGSDRYIH